MFATFTDDDEQPITPDTVTCTVRDPSGVTSNPAAASIGGGTYQANVEVDDSGWWSWRMVGLTASFKGVVEGTFYVKPSYVTPELDILDAPDDLEAVRNVMGLTAWDVTDDLIRANEFAWQAEYRVKKEFADWSTATGDTLILLKLASVYATAALLSESYAKGGTIGNTEGGDADQERDWVKFAALMWSRYQEFMASVNDEAAVEIDYDLDGMVLAHRSREVGRDWSTAWPPVFDADLPAQTS